MNFISSTKKIAGMGSSCKGTSSYKMQRNSAYLLVFLVAWLVYIMSVIIGDDAGQVVAIILSPFHTIMAVLFMVTFLLHGSLGIKVIIQDYVQSDMLRSIAVSLLNLVNFVSLLAGLLAILRLHIVFSSVAG
jgi:succinate dehydrogenase / fumarate reductase membrane anchor subunit